MLVRLPAPRRLVSRALVSTLVAAAALTAFACDLAKLNEPKLTPAELATKLAAAVGKDSIVSMGGTLTLSVTTTEGALPAAATVAWLSDKPTVATVNPTTGVVTGVSLGTAKISATVSAPGIGEVTATPLTIRVRYAGLSIKAVDSLIAVGMTRVIDVRGTNPAGVVQASIPFSAAMTVTSRDLTVLTVNPAGALVAVKNSTGTGVRIVVQYDGLTDSVLVKVRQVARAITYAGTVAGELPVGSLNLNRTIAITVADSLGVAIPTPTVTWATSDALTVTVVATTGVARALKVGTATITATSDGFAKAILARVVQVPATLTKSVSTDGLAAVVNTAVASPPEVTVADSGGSIMSGVSVTFTVASGGGSVTGATAISGGTGKAAPTSWILGTTAGANTMLAAAGVATATFTATGTSGAAKKLLFTTQPTPASVNTAIATIRVSVADSLDNIVTTATPTITLSVGSGTGTLGGTVTAAAVAGVASFSTVTLNTAGPFTLTASGTGLAGATSNSFAIFGTPTQLIFTTQPIGGTAGQALTLFRVSVADVGGNTVGNATNTVTLAISVTGAVGAVLTGTISTPAVAGVATFTTASIDKQGVGYKLSATATLLTGAVSNAFTVDPVGPPAKLGFVVQPSNVAAGAGISPAIQVAVQDAGGVTATTSTASVTLAFETNAGVGTLSGVVTVAAVAGVATFPGININRVGTGYRLNATSGTLTKGVSALFNVTPGPVTQLKFLVQPSNAVTAAAIAPPVQVALQDASGNTVTSATSSIALASSGGGGGTLTGGTAVPAVAGVASFSALSLSLAGSNYQLVASSTGLTNVSSATFNVVSGTAAIKVHFVTQPSNAASRTAMSPSVQVVVQDNSGTTVTAPAVTVTLAIGTNPSGGAFTGTTTSALTVGGIATFTDVQLNLVGTGYTIIASATGLNSETSNAFNITAAAASKVGFLTQPATVVAGTAFATNIQVAVQDASGNTVPTATNVVTLSIFNNVGGSGLRGTTSVTAVSGVATFTGVSLNRTGVGYSLSASSSLLNSTGSSASFDVTAAPAIALAFKTQPNTVVAGALQTSAIQVSVVDSVGNVITTATDPITIAIATGPAGGVIGGTKTASAVAGVATFASLTFSVAGVYTLAATATNLSTVTSFGFSVNGGTAVALAWGQTPVNGVRNAALQSAGSNALRVDVVDALGNVVGSTASILISISTNPGTATLGGTVAGTANGGQLFAGNLTISAAGTGYRLTAASTGLTSAVTGTFDIAAFGPVSQLTFAVGPTNTTGGVAFSPALQVAIADNVGNVITTSASTTIFIGVNNNPTSTSLAGTTTTTTTAGVAVFSGVSIPKAGAGYTLFACTSGITPQYCGSSGAFDVTVGAAARLDFNVQPTFTTGGIALNPVVKVAVSDLGGNAVVSFAATPITVALTSPGTATLSGTKTVSTVSGVATFTGLSIDKSNVYSLTATATGFAAQQSENFFIGTGPAAKLAFTQQPAATTFVNARLNPGGSVQVEIQDAGGNGVNASDVVSFAVGANPGSATLNGTKASTASFGTATLNNDVSLSTAGTGYTIVASATGLTSATSNPFNVGAFSTASALAFTVQPTGAVINTNLTPAPKVAVVDQYGNVVTSSVLTITIGTQTGPGAVGGATGVAATSGVATFAALTFATTGTYTIFASSSVNSTVSTSFAITAAQAPTISRTPATLTFTGNAGGASPAAQTVAVTNSGTGTLSSLAIGTITYGIEQPGGWLTAGLNVTTAPATVTVTPATGSIAAGTYTATVPVTSTAAGITNSPQNISVTFTISATSACTPTAYTLGVLANGTLADTDCDGPTSPHDNFSFSTASTTFFSTTVASSAFTTKTLARVWPPASNGLFLTGTGTPSTSIIYYLLAAATYQLEIGRPALIGTGAYTLTSALNPTLPTGCWSTLASRNVSATQTLDAGCAGTHDSLSGTAGTATSIRSYYIWQAAGAPLTIQMGSTTFDTYLEAYDFTSGTLIGYDDDGGLVGTDSELVIAAPVSGRFVRIAAGNYNFGSSALVTSTFTFTIVP